jgi:hypothetical protein
MNLNNNPTMDQLRDLLRACDDRAGRHIMWADRAGEVRVTPIPSEVTDFVRSQTDLRMWLRVFVSGQNYVGPAAAEDTGWVEDLYLALRKNWPKAQARNAVTAVEDW